MIMMMMVTMMMMICDLIRQAAACGFPMVATACQGLGFQLGLRSFFSIKVMIIMMKTMTITMILMLKDVDDGDENIIVVEGCFLRPRPPLKV